MVDMEMQVYNVEGLGPVVSLHSVAWMLQDVANQGHGVVGGVKLSGTIRMLGEIKRAARGEPLVRLSPTVPGGSVKPFLATIEVTR